MADFSIRKPNNAELAIGFDLTDTFSEVSFSVVDSEEVSTLSMVAGGTSYLIPTVLFKRSEVNQWFVGKDAIRFKDTDGFFVDHIVKRINEEEIMVGMESFKPSALIALFMRRALSMVSTFMPGKDIVSLMVTVSDLDTRTVEVLEEAVASLGLKNAKVYFQGHSESFYHYNIYQEEELWRHDVLLLDFSNEEMRSFRMECNSHTTPVVAFIDSNIFSEYSTESMKNLVPETLAAKGMDEALAKTLDALLEGHVFSSIYLIGDAFKQEVFPETIRHLCKKGRVFQGNNLYAKGACYAAKSHVVTSVVGENHVFLGNNKLKANVGLNVSKRGENAYLPLLDAGINWFDASKECEVYLNQGNKISFVVTPLTGKDPKVVDITLQELQKRPPKTTRVHLSLKMISENKLEVKAKDLGFGELFPTSDTEWNEVIQL